MEIEDFLNSVNYYLDAGSYRGRGPALYPFELEVLHLQMARAFKIWCNGAGRLDAVNWTIIHERIDREVELILEKRNDS